MKAYPCCSMFQIGGLAHADSPREISVSVRSKMPALLTGRRILVVEDEYFLAEDVAFALRRLGAEIVGPVGNLAEAAEAVATNAIDGAALDVNVCGRTV